MDIISILPRVKRPSRYIGTETNARRKPWEGADIRAALIFPDLYEIGMSHMGLQILYAILNDLEWCLADRSYCPDTDMEGLMRRHNIPAWGVESRRPLKEFDILAFTLPYELCYVNILTILDLAGIPFHAADRNRGDYPVIIGGGSCALNPEPVADFFDAILCGDGEEAVVEIADCVREWKAAGRGARQELLEALARIDGVYIPSFYRAAPSGKFVFAEPAHHLAGEVRRRIIPALHDYPGIKNPLVPYMQIVHDRLGIEIARGCTRGCRFCQAGIIYRPVRERPLDQILDTAERELSSTGWDELSLLSLSTGDYTCLNQLIHELMQKQRQQHVSVSLPSLRVGTLTQEIMEEIRSVRKTGFTLAPEAGSERLRQVINKGITEEDLMETARLAYSYGWSHMKLYFMTGLPTETLDDVHAISELARKVWEQGKGARGKRQVTVSVGTFVPKPHTPFQWEPQIDIEESRRRIDAIRSGLRAKAFRVKWHDPRQSFLEGVFSRGDRRLAKILEVAWRKGARLDAWTDSMKPHLYEAAAGQLDIDLNIYLGPREEGETLAWDHIKSGVHTEYLLKEREKAWQGEYTSDCRKGGCHICGVCDFKKIKPVIFKEGVSGKEEPSRQTGTSSLPQLQKPGQGKEERYFCKIGYCKMDDARFLGHLEMVHAFHRAAKRAGIPLAYSKGFHPMPRVSFGQPLSLGMESLMEEAVLELRHPVDKEKIISGLNHTLPLGMQIISAITATRKLHMEEPETLRYLVLVADISAQEARERTEKFRNSSSWLLERIRKGKIRKMDARPQVESIEVCSPATDGFSGLLSDQEAKWATGRLAKIRDEGRDVTLMVLTLKRLEGAGLKPQEIIASVTGCCDGLKPTELFGMMQILKSRN